VVVSVHGGQVRMVISTITLVSVSTPVQQLKLTVGIYFQFQLDYSLTINHTNITIGLIILRTIHASILKILSVILPITMPMLPLLIL